jgi:O-antigen/teichoic acid export membrane protein
MIRYSLPLVPNELSWWIFSSSDRFIIAAFIDLSSTGILSISYKFSNILIVIYNVFNMSLAESISLHIKDSDVGKYFNKVFNDVFKLFVSFGILLLAFMPILFKLLINSSYNDAYNLIPIAIVASLFQIVVGLLGTIYVANKNTKSIANSSIVAAIVNIVIDLLLVKYIGIYAAVVSTLVSYLILMIYRYIDIKKKYLDVKFNKKSTILNILILSIVIFAYYIDNPLVKIITMAISVIYFFYINKQSLNLMFNMLKSKINEKGEQK